MALHAGPSGGATSLSPVAFPLLAPVGNQAAPSYSFAGFSGDGLFSAANGIIDISIGGTGTHRFGASNYYLFNNSGVIAIGGSADVVLTRDANGSAILSSSTRQTAFGTAALNTNATIGFPCMQSTAGVATGTPSNIPTGQIPFVVNSVTGQIGMYSGGWTWLPKTLTVSSSAVGNINTGTDDLISYTMPANVLAADGKTLRIKAWGSTVNNANTKQLTLNWGSQVVCNTALTQSIAGMWEVEATIIRTGGNTQDVVARCLQGATLIFDQELTGGTQTDTAQIIVKMTGTATTTNDIVQEGLVVEVIN